MPEEYSTEQNQALSQMYDVVKQLVEVEELQNRRYQPILSLKNALDQATADIALDNYPSYANLEARLRRTINQAREAGLGDHPDVKIYAKLAGAI